MPTGGKGRELRMAVSEDLRKEYLDENINFCFKTKYLQLSATNIETCFRPVDNTKEGKQKQKNDEIERTLSEVRAAKEAWKLESIEKKLNVKKYEREQCAGSWMSKFESECERFAVVLDGDKIRAMKQFLGDSPSKWYEYKETSLDADDWTAWKSSFLKAIGANGCDQVRETHRFRIKDGSFTDYACKKVKLLIDADPKLDESTLVSLIVIGIRIRYQEKISRQEVKTVDDLMAILNTFPPLTSAHWNQPKKGENEKNQSGQWKNKKP